MQSLSQIKSSLAFLPEKLIEEIINDSDFVELDKGEQLLREGQYVKVIPVVVEGLVKVFTRRENKELLLYYIQPKESCIMSFAAGLKNEPSKVYAQTEESSAILLLPMDKIQDWVKRYPPMNNLFYQQYNKRYSDLLDTIHHVLFDKLDKRVYEHLKEKSKLTKKNPLKISHRQLAAELGTAREVVSRILKKLEHEGLVEQLNTGIKLLKL